MKINHITVENVIGLRHVDADLPTPLTMFIGPNGAGKTSLQESIRMALTGNYSRVKLRKDFTMLVHEGQKKGCTSVIHDGGEVGMLLPSGRHAGDMIEDSKAIEYILDPSLFASVDDKTRRSFLFDLAGIQINTDEVRKRLETRKVNMKLAEEVLPLLRSGFPAAHKTAAENATLSKGSWKATTGEQWGAKKAEGWEVEVPAAIDDKTLQTKIQQAEKLNADISIENQKLGKLQQMFNASESEAETVERLKEQAAPLKDLEITLAVANDQYQDEKAVVADLAERANAPESQACPHCKGAIAVLHGKVISAEVAAIDREAVKRLATHKEALAMLERTLSNKQRDYNQAKAADDALNNRPAIEPVSQGDIEKCRGRITAMTGTRTDLNEEIRELRDMQNEVVSIEKNNKLATQYHEEIMSWLAIAEAFAPDGIPGEMLTEALQPLNNRLRASATATGWMQARITADMEIEANGRLYCLFSESEKWRIDAMLAEAISHVSGLKTIMLDRFDVLDLAGRGELLNWMIDLAEKGEIESGLLFGTLKQLPNGIEHTTAHWLENGVIG
jgi:energy-coupling factor transporter ATP-binding protein EcfA2